MGGEVRGLSQWKRVLAICSVVRASRPESTGLEALQIASRGPGTLPLGVSAELGATTTCIQAAWEVKYNTIYQPSMLIK